MSRRRAATSSRTHYTATPALDDELVELARLFADDYLAYDGPPVAIGVTEQTDSGQLALRELLTGDVAAELIGFRAPADWWAFGIACRGKAWPCGEGDDPTGRYTVERTGTPKKIVMAEFVARGGASVSLIDGEIGQTSLGVEDPAMTGRVPDACRRVLGLPTAPPARDSREWWAAHWLGAVYTEAVASDEPLTWPEVVALHPGADIVNDLEPEIGAFLSGRVVELGNALGRAWSWSRIRAVCSAGGNHVEQTAGLSSAGAAWMDDGMFARWLMAECPPLLGCLEIIDELVTVDVARQMRGALEAWRLVD